MSQIEDEYQNSRCKTDNIKISMIALTVSGLNMTIKR